MASRRSEINMSPAEIEAFLDEERIINIATIGPSGHPHLVAMWYVVIDGKVVFWTFGRSQKIVNLRRDGRMTGLVEAGDSYGELRGVEIVGSGRLVETYDDILAIGRAVSARYYGDGALTDAALPALEAQARKRVGVVFEVERIATWDHRKLGAGY